MKIETLHDLYLMELRDLYGSEKLLLKSLPRLLEKAQLPELRQTLRQHLEETREHVSRLEQVFQIHGETPSIKKGKSLDGILHEAEEDVRQDSAATVRDASIIAAVQQMEHFEIAAYATLHQWALHLGHEDAARILQQTLEEERTADQTLSDIVAQHLQVEVTRTA